MAAKSFGSFGTFKFEYLDEAKKAPKDAPIDITNVTHGVLKDVEYFQKNLARSTRSNQIVNYTWEKPIEESPSIFTPSTIPGGKFKQQHTLEIMSTYHGHPHVKKQNRWEEDPTQPPEFHPNPQKRRTVVLSAMTQYVEEINKTFPGGQ